MSKIVTNQFMQEIKELFKNLSIELTKEFGKGFTFVSRQKRFSFDEEHFRVDLCFITDFCK